MNIKLLNLRNFAARGLVALILSPAFCNAAAQYVPVGAPLPRFSLLKEGAHRYLRFFKSGDSNFPIDIWYREIRFENGHIRIRQRWDSGGKQPSTKTMDSLFEVSTFRPLSHIRISTQGDKRVVEGFTFSSDHIFGMTDLAENTQKELSVASPEQTFNFETDMEFLQALPLAEGYEAEANFYHPGAASAPARYRFKVDGSANIAGPSGPVDCWRMTTDYNSPGAISTFWIAKSSQLMLRQESPLPDGRVLVKTLID